MRYIENIEDILDGWEALQLLDSSKPSERYLALEYLDYHGLCGNNALVWFLLTQRRTVETSPGVRSFLEAIFRC